MCMTCSGRAKSDTKAKPANIFIGRNTNKARSNYGRSATAFGQPKIRISFSGKWRS